MNPFFKLMATFLIFSPTSFAQSSSDHRQEKTVLLATEIGSSVYPLPSAGFTLGYFASSDLRLEANYTKGEIDIFDEMSSKLYVARAKYFIGNSFYVNAGVGYRQLDLVLNEWLSDRRLGRSMHHVGGEFSFGNSWQFSGFTLGCDWAGYFHPVKKLKDTRQSSGSTRSIFGARTDQSSEADDDYWAEERWEDYASKGTFQAVRFNLGWSF